MTVKEKQDLIVEQLLAKGYKIDSVSYSGRCQIIARKKFAEISITTEECMCHGGRLWIGDNHTSQHYELSHSQYDESKGITDSTSELKYIIQNELEEYLEKYSTFSYKVVVINEFRVDANGLDNERISYHSSLKSASRRFHNQVKDIIGLDEQKCTYPNTDIYETIERIEKTAKYSWEQNRIWARIRRFTRKNEKAEFVQERSYEAYLDIFKK